MIAKKPEDRPASSAAVARAATALRRGDVAAAAAAVPADRRGAAPPMTPRSCSRRRRQAATSLPARAATAERIDDEPREEEAQPVDVAAHRADRPAPARARRNALRAASRTRATDPDPTTSQPRPPRPRDEPTADADAHRHHGRRRCARDLVGQDVRRGAAHPRWTRASWPNVRGGQRRAEPTTRSGIVYAFDPRATSRRARPSTLTVYGPVTPVGAPADAPTLSSAASASRRSGGLDGPAELAELHVPVRDGNAQLVQGHHLRRHLHREVRRRAGLRAERPQADVLVGDAVGQTVTVTYIVTCTAEPRRLGIGRRRWTCRSSRRRPRPEDQGGDDGEANRVARRA